MRIGIWHQDVVACPRAMSGTLYRELDQGFVSCLAREQFPPMERTGGYKVDR
jgi:hypothetical protein